MIEIDFTWVLVTIISTAGMITLSQLVQHNYYKREDYKYKNWQKKSADTLNFQKLRRDLKLSEKHTPPAPPPENTLVDLIKNVDTEKIKALAGLVKKQDEYEVEDEEADDQSVSWVDTIANVVKENPDEVKKIASKFGLIKGENKDEIEGFSPQG